MLNHDQQRTPWVSFEGNACAYESRSMAHRRAIDEALSSQLELPIDEIDAEARAAYQETIISEIKASELVGIHAYHRFWPDILEESSIEPELKYQYKRAEYYGGRCIVGTATYFAKADVPKLLIAATKFDRPKDARTISELSTALNLGNRVVDETLKENGIGLQSFRNPETETFDEYVTIDGIKALFNAVKSKKEAYRAAR